MSRTALLLFLGFLAYAALGSVALRLWRRRTRRPRPTTLYASPDAWLAYWLPQVISVEAWALVGTGVLCFLLTIISPLFKGADGATVKLGFIFGLVGYTPFFAAFDAVMVVRTRQVARRQRAANQARPTNPDQTHPSD